MIGIFFLSQIFFFGHHFQPSLFCSFLMASMFPELVLVHGRLSSCWELWQNATSFCQFTSFSHSALLLFSVGKSVDVFALFMCVCVVNPEHSACLRMLLPQYQPPPCRGICPHPSYLLLCVCHRSILFTTSPLLPILPLGCSNTEQG